MKKLNWISRLLGSLRADEKRSDFCLKNSESLEEVKSVKKNEIPQRGQFNIMQSYGNREFPNKQGELISSGAAVEPFKGRVYIEDIPEHIMQKSREFGDTRTKQELIDYVNSRKSNS